MLVGSKNAAIAVLRWQRAVWSSALVSIVAVLSLTPYLRESTEIVRMRNALLLIDRRNVDFNWTPANVPPSFQLERGPVDPFFTEVVDRLQLVALPNDWERALAISRHLLGSSPVLVGGAIKSDLRNTYKHIVTKGDGYCGDFVDVFMAIALAAGIPVRSWAFSFDGFGGNGHIWPEIWNRQLQRWQLVGVFNNYYFFETAGEPLSALGFRRAMLGNSNLLKRAPLDPGARVGWTIDEKAWDYYRRGLPEWYMWWGNNVFTYDRSLLVRTFSHISRSTEQLGGILQGVHPGLQILTTPENRRQVDALSRLRVHLLLAGSVAVLACATWAVSMLGLRRAQRISVGQR